MPHGKTEAPLLVLLPSLVLGLHLSTWDSARTLVHDSQRAGGTGFQLSPGHALGTVRPATGQTKH